MLDADERTPRQADLSDRKLHATKLRAAALKLVSDPEYQAELRARLLMGTCSPAVETMLWGYVLGKPKETLDISGETRTVRRVELVIVDPRQPGDAVQDDAVQDDAPVTRH